MLNMLPPVISTLSPHRQHWCFYSKAAAGHAFSNPSQEDKRLMRQGLELTVYFRIMRGRRERELWDQHNLQRELSCSSQDLLLPAVYGCGQVHRDSSDFQFLPWLQFIQFYCPAPALVSTWASAKALAATACYHPCYSTDSSSLVNNATCQNLFLFFSSTSFF